MATTRHPQTLPDWRLELSKLCDDGVRILTEAQPFTIDPWLPFRSLSPTKRFSLVPSWTREGFFLTDRKVPEIITISTEAVRTTGSETIATRLAARHRSLFSNGAFQDSVVGPMLGGYTSRIVNAKKTRDQLQRYWLQVPTWVVSTSSAGSSSLSIRVKNPGASSWERRLEVILPKGPLFDRKACDLSQVFVYELELQISISHALAYRVLDTGDHKSTRLDAVRGRSFVNGRCLVQPQSPDLYRIQDRASGTSIILEKRLVEEPRFDVGRWAEQEFARLGSGCHKECVEAAPQCKFFQSQYSVSSIKYMLTLWSL